MVRLQAIVLARIDLGPEDDGGWWGERELLKEDAVMPPSPEARRAH